MASANQQQSGVRDAVLVDARRLGLSVRALRRRRGWRQVDLARAADVSQTTISFVERGHLQTLPLRTLSRIAAVLEATVAYELRWRGAALDRLLDEGHARLGAAVAGHLRQAGWLVRIEVSYSHFGERGAIDIVAWHADAASLLVVELKTDLASAEELIRKLDEKTRLAPRIAREQFGWHAKRASRLIVFPERQTLRRKLERHGAYVTTALPVAGRSVRRWLRKPQGSIAAVWFFSTPGTSIAGRPYGERVRRR